jgi:hypothetical protein
MYDIFDLDYNHIGGGISFLVKANWMKMEDLHLSINFMIKVGIIFNPMN